MSQQIEFEHLGYFKEYYIANKFIGKVNCEKDRETFGYYGKQTETLQADIVLEGKRKIKAGTEVVTQLFPLCGKITKI